MSGLDQIPRDMFFKAEDLRVGPDALPEAEVSTLSNKRFNDHRRMVEKLGQLTEAAKVIRSFDRTGNAEDAIGHLVGTADDAFKLVRNFARDVSLAGDRFRTVTGGDDPSDSPTFSAAAVEPSPTVPVAADTRPVAAKPLPQAKAAAGPIPGPGTHVIHISGADAAKFHPSIVGESPASTPADLAAIAYRLAQTRNPRSAQRSVG